MLKKDDIKIDFDGKIYTMNLEFKPEHIIERLTEVQAVYKETFVQTLINLIAEKAAQEFIRTKLHEVLAHLKPQEIANIATLKAAGKVS